MQEIFSCLEEVLGMPDTPQMKTAVFFPLLDAVFHPPAILKASARGQQTTKSGRVSGAGAAPQPAEPIWNLSAEGDAYWITGRLLRRFSELDGKAVLVEGKPELPQFHF